MLPFPHETDVPLSSLSTLGIGGPARFVTTATTMEEMRLRLRFCHQEKMPFLILGLGSNCLFDDRGYSGLVILNKINHLELQENHLRVGAGYSFARLGGQMSRQGWSGLEFAAGIPATVGGAIFMNAGAGGSETADVLSEVVYLTDEGEKRCFAREDLAFGYRSSSFQKWRGAIVEGTFLLTPSTEARAVQKKLLNYRLKTQPYGEKSAGCAFRNPDGAPVGKLIEELGLKGLSVGGAIVSREHGNFIVNQGGATTKDVQALIAHIQETLLREKGIALETEMRYIPYDDLF